jgi:tyrosine-protein phosphatase SIW14
MRLNTALARTYTAVLLALVLASPAAARPQDSRSSANVVQGSSIRIDNFGQVNAHYYRGAQPNGRDYSDLAALGVKTVIDLTSDDAQTNEKSLTEHVGMRYFQIPMTTHQAPTPAQLTEFLKLVNDPANQPVYVHCVGGRHRTGVMTAAYRMTQDGWGADQAFKEMKQYKFGADFLHSEFKQFVYGYTANAHAVAAEAAVPTTKAGG